MVSNKDRLYVALYARHGTGPDPEPYHWGLIRSPKGEDYDATESTRYHVRNIPTSDGQVWEYETRDVRSRATYNLLVRILISKIDPGKVGRMESILNYVEIIQDDPGWNCKSWVEVAVAELAKAGIIRRWKFDDIEGKARWFVQKKTGEGRFETPDEGSEYDDRVPTWDIIADRETQS